MVRNTHNTEWTPQPVAVENKIGFNGSDVGEKQCHGCCVQRLIPTAYISPLGVLLADVLLLLAPR